MVLKSSLHILPVSVVIATLAGKELEQTIQYLRNGLSVPDEILICIPQGVTVQANIVEDACVRVIWTPCRGQVAQRAFGLAQARNAYVMQMDDDVTCSENTLKLLYESLVKLGSGHALSPIFKNGDTHEFLTQYSRNTRGILKSIMATLIGGAPWGYRRMGKIDRSGIPYAIDRRFVPENTFIETEWLPGGCVLCHKDDLVLDNYYPFSGKAYSEDVIHSLVWRQRGIRLWVASHIVVSTYIAPMPATLKSILADYRARAHVVSLSAGNLWRCRLWFLLYFMRTSLCGLFRK